LRIDEIESLGSARLRLRSMIESVRARLGVPGVAQPRPARRVFMRSDNLRMLLVPEFSLFATVPLIRPLRDMGFRVEILPIADRASVDEGLKYVNNEICYPAIVVIGDMIKALKSGRYRHDEVALITSQTGGQCRDSCYLPLLNKALAANNLGDVPVVSFSTSFQPLNEQPGLQVNYPLFVYKLMYSLTLADSLSSMYHAIASRERLTGAALDIAGRYMARLDNGSIPLRRGAVLAEIRAAAAEFNKVDVRTEDRPRAAIVGEIFLKLNSFANSRVAQWLMNQGVEVEVPPLVEYFTSAFVNSEADVHAGLRRRDLNWGVTKLVRGFVESFLREADAARRAFRFYRPFHDIAHVAAAAREVIDLTNHYGEGWLIPGEIGAYVESGVPNILCIQPFGCMANQVTARGIERRLMKRYPQLNILYIDIDAGASEVNLQNRLHFFISHAFARQAVSTH
jgi:predicted nucleotide-binding protein (sugar kinase/HSP70/actin superfamily)